MAKWRNRIEIKHVLTDDTDNQSVLNVCNVLIPKLKRLHKKEIDILAKRQERNQTIYVDEYFLGELEEVIGYFEFVKECVEKDFEPSDYSFDSWCEALNEYLSMLYDMGDSIVKEDTFYNTEKFLWVG